MLEGTLSKWTNVMKGWQYRWFVLDENAGLLSYYTVSIFSTFSVTYSKEQLGHIFLKNYCRTEKEHLFLLLLID